MKYPDSPASALNARSIGVKSVNVRMETTIQTSIAVAIVCENTSDAFLFSFAPRSLPAMTDPPTPTQSPTPK